MHQTELPRRVAVTGSSGFIGSALVRSLRERGVEVIPIVRREARPGEVRWDPQAGKIDAAGLEGIGALVHLAGESIAGVWTRAKKRRIHESRVRGTRLIARTLSTLEERPSVMVSASGVNYYGDSGEALLKESSPPGNDFLARVCVEWEAATEPARDAGIRVVRTRSGIVLDPDGGALPLMMVPFRFGLGARLGDGRQWMSWISRSDLVRAIEFAVSTDTLVGPVNTVAPDPVRNEEFTRVVARELRRPAFFRIPEFALRAVPGEMAETLLLASQRAAPSVLTASGFVFGTPHLADAISIDRVD